MDPRFTANFHTHTWRCRHAGGSPIEFAAVAAANGLKTLGISDHMPYADNRFGLRMPMAEFQDYLQDIQTARETFPQLKIYSGLECEYLPQERKHLEALRSQLDYMILGQHFFQEGDHTVFTYDLTDSRQFLSYARSIRDALATGLFDCVAHPDLIGVHDRPMDGSYIRAAEIILDAAERYGVPLEINANGVRNKAKGWHSVHREWEHNYPYPDSRFFRMAAQRDGLRFVINADAHSPRELCGPHIGKTFAFADAYGLPLLETLPIR